MGCLVVTAGGVMETQQPGKELVMFPHLAQGVSSLLLTVAKGGPRAGVGASLGCTHVHYEQPHNSARGWGTDGDRCNVGCKHAWQMC